MLVGQPEKSQKDFDLLAFNWDLNHSDLLCTLDAMKFQKWELVPGSPQMCSIYLVFDKIHEQKV